MLTRLLYALLAFFVFDLVLSHIDVTAGIAFAVALIVAGLVFLGAERF